VPSQLGEDTFWQVYFSLIERKTDSVDWERSTVEETKQETVATEESEEVIITHTRAPLCNMLASPPNLIRPYTHTCVGSRG
jgi:hypothetical protein